MQNVHRRRYSSPIHDNLLENLRNVYQQQRETGQEELARRTEQIYNEYEQVVRESTPVLEIEEENNFFDRTFCLGVGAAASLVFTIALFIFQSFTKDSM